MIIVHGVGHPEESGEGSREERAVGLDPSHIVGVLIDTDGHSLVVSRSQTKDGSIMLKVDESQLTILALKRVWERHWDEQAENSLQFPVAVRQGEETFEFIDMNGAIIEGIRW